MFVLYLFLFSFNLPQLCMWIAMNHILPLQGKPIVMKTIGTHPTQNDAHDAGLVVAYLRAKGSSRHRHCTAEGVEGYFSRYVTYTNACIIPTGCGTTLAKTFYAQFARGQDNTICMAYNLAKFPQILLCEIIYVTRGGGGGTTLFNKL